MLPALEVLERLAAQAPAVETLAVAHGMPVRAFRFGTDDKRAPALLVTGGVHGLERIGTDVALAYLTSLIARLAWDAVLHDARTDAQYIPLQHLSAQQGSFTIRNSMLSELAVLGFEYGFSPNWSFGVEYDHLWMGTANNSFSAADPRLVTILNDRISQDVDTFTLRVNYRFGGYGAPVTARY